MISAKLRIMAHRPYPHAGRAWRQIMRRHRYQRPAHLSDPPAHQCQPGRYVLSRRRPV